MAPPAAPLPTACPSSLPTPELSDCGSFDTSESSSRKSSLGSECSEKPTDEFVDEVIGKLNNVIDTRADDLERTQAIDIKKFFPSQNNESVNENMANAWKVEADAAHRYLEIIPGIRKILKAIPVSRYAIITKSAKSYGKYHRFITRTRLIVLRN